MNENIIMTCCVFLMGASFGSFLNVVISRVPLGINIVFPGSHCYSCKTQIKWYDNIPILSYFILSGKCRFCEEKFSIKYPAVELMTALITISLFYIFKLTPIFFIYTILCYILIAITFIDIDHLIIPDGFIIFGFIFLVITTIAGWMPISIKSSTAGAFFFSGFLLLIGFIGEKILKKEAMGGGDIKLGFIIGGFLGFKISILTLYLSFITAGFIILFGLSIKKISTKKMIPFGPYLALGTLLALLSNRVDEENIILNWYFSLAF
tara:strand:- start:23 stop:817 length:795 start_codon:yes stop_codon:yes gene_type:complete